MLKEKLQQDIKTALLAGDKQKAEVLKSLKSALLYEEVEHRTRGELTEQHMLEVLAREAKKRAESAQLYEKAGEAVRAAAELQEKAIIEAYLPAQMSDDQLQKIVDDVLASMPNAQLGQAIGAVRVKVDGNADGARIAAAVKAKLGA